MYKQADTHMDAANHSVHKQESNLNTQLFLSSLFV